MQVLAEHDKGMSYLSLVKTTQFITSLSKFKSYLPELQLVPLFRYALET